MEQEGNFAILYGHEPVQQPAERGRADLLDCGNGSRGSVRAQGGGNQWEFALLKLNKQPRALRAMVWAVVWGRADEADTGGGQENRFHC